MTNPYVQLLHWTGSEEVSESTGTNEGWINTLTGRAS
jgi:hypothetical protein